MTDDAMYKMIEEFANETSIAQGGNIHVTRTQYSTSLNPIDTTQGMKYEDTKYLTAVIDGAEAFLFWLRRKQWEITKHVNSKKHKTKVRR